MAVSQAGGSSQPYPRMFVELDLILLVYLNRFYLPPENSGGLQVLLLNLGNSRTRTHSVNNGNDPATRIFLLQLAPDGESQRSDQVSKILPARSEILI